MSVAVDEADTAKVLLVDDRADNLLALQAVLQPLELDLVAVRSGADALIALLEDEFALVILDVQMPDMDGFETAQLIRRRERTRLLPIIFLTAISGELEHHLEGYRSGAVDYVYKPFDPDILRAKVSVFVELWERGRLIESQRRSLADQLAAVDRLNEELERSNAVLDGFASRAAEDLLEPLDALAGFLELLAERHAEVLGDAGAQLVERAVVLAGRQRARVVSLLEYADAGTATVQGGPIDLELALKEALERLGPRAEGAAVSIVPGSARVVCSEQRQLVRILEVLIERAVAHSEASVVTVDAHDEGGVTLVRVADDGRTLAGAELAAMFSPVGGSHGIELGAMICRRLVERHGGTIWATAREPTGTAVTFSLPEDPRP